MDVVGWIPFSIRFCKTPFPCRPFSDRLLLCLKLLPADQLPVSSCPVLIDISSIYLGEKDLVIGVVGTW